MITFENYPTCFGRWAKMFLLLAAIPLTYRPVLAQQGSSGNTTIFGGAQMTFFGQHNFQNGGGGTQPGIIYTIRTAPFGVLNFAPSAPNATGMDDANYVDGYVRRLGTTPFVFPVGDNGRFGPFAAQADGTMGAYFFANPTSAVTSMLPSGDYPVLPAGGPFPSASFREELDAVSSVEYWDIDGTNATPLTLTWDAVSAISALTNGDIKKLTIAGWDGTQWVALPSIVDVTSVLGGTSDLPAGSITTTASIVPNTYTAYTFASRDVPLPVTLATFEALKEGGTTKLTWTTTEEINSDRFEIERYTPTSNWKKIGVVASSGESRVLKSYDFTDSNPEGGQNLYRLRMIDLDGTFAFSRIRSIEFPGKGKSLVYPNPTSDLIILPNYQQISTIRIVTMAGQTVLTKSGLITEKLSLLSVQTGPHIVQIEWLDGRKSAQNLLIAR